MITGVSSGIGYDSTKYLIEQGYTVLGSVRKQADADRISGELGINYIPLIFDVTDKEQIKASRPKVEEVLGGDKLKAIINNAGIAQGGPIELLDDDKFR